ncbi:LAO/AO transport system kinase [Deltaproteobacteria bacterium]|nr:LAO/AO transport system kinase [Deltaproteobacteria bacterium]
MPNLPDPLVARALAGDRAALARLISRVEARAPGADAIMAGLPARRRSGPGAPRVVGITGPPGAGKSTFTDRIVTAAREERRRVGVVAVDPSSPFTGGAILGDRLRLDQHAMDPGVYIRSLSARGHSGGLSRAAGQVVDVLDAAGYDDVIVETVGVGQGELGIMEVADTVLVVLTPESGDGVQAMKAGLLEIADVFVVNKADRPGAEALVRELELAVHLDMRPGWKAPVFAASARTGVGVDDVLGALRAHADWLQADGREAWEARRAEGRVRTWLDLVSEDARNRAVEQHGEAMAELRRGDRTPESMPR